MYDVHLPHTLLKLLINSLNLLSQDLQLLVYLLFLSAVLKLLSEVLILVLEGLVVGLEILDGDGGVHDGLVGSGLILEHVVGDFEVVVFDLESFILLDEDFVVEGELSDHVGGSDHDGRFSM